jgi:serine phosphatase RsbU (regulator of sigma subunit)
VIARKGGEFETIGSVAPPLGLVEAPEFAETKAVLGPGDSFLLYTDGLLGNADKKRPRTTPETLGKLIDRAGSDADAMLKKVVARTVPADNGGELADDIAAVLVLRTS